MIAFIDDFLVKLIVPWKRLIGRGLMVPSGLIQACGGVGSACTPALSGTVVRLVHASLLGMLGGSVYTPALGGTIIQARRVSLLITRIALACGGLVPWAASGQPTIREQVVVVGQSSLCLVALPGPLQQQLQLLRRVIRVTFGCVLTMLKPIKSLCNPIELVI